MIKNELFFVFSKQHRQRIPVFGTRQTEFLVFSNDGWVWAPMKDFRPLKAKVWDYDDQVQYVNVNGRPGMIKEAPKLLLQDHGTVIDADFGVNLE